MHYQPAQSLMPGALPAAARTLPVTTVMGIPLVSAEPHDVARHLLCGSRATVAFANAHCVNVRARDRAYAAALRRTDYILPDGIGVELAARMQGRNLTANLNGTDFVPLLLQHAARLGLSVFLIGGKPGTAAAAAARLSFDIPGLRIAGSRDGYGGAVPAGPAVRDINESGADIVLVAMGVPRQELWVDQNRHLLNASLVLSVGALLDFLAGNVRRAPAVVRRARMEWVWRLALEPKRLAQRYLIGNLTFMTRAAHYAIARADREQAAQRGLDAMLTGTALVALALPMMVVAMLIRLDSKGPALFRQTRIGRDGKPFEMLKFRSMQTDAEARRADLLQTSDREGVCFKSRNDPRVTRIGRFLRRTSLDELPQLINVLRGDMSLVGPRPALPEEVAAYPGHARGRLKTRPGITGIWQVSGRASIGFDKMIDMDLAYVRSRSILLDLMLIALTFRAVVSGRGAY
ncbi:WecB/TagA/CpsF family glycosyltransferase [uncultured Roseobacter sp.]|uniref:WecB/TagA/CpsF family glycosyltransferase n=1 Tax=uncultured Roseobacter sp. TaxID=114847 RepID=UPI00260A4C7B|nr:WecB/TagA/CpsF family glycosyltransferase [uncultured Roseobacter sp.]